MKISYFTLIFTLLLLVMWSAVSSVTASPEYHLKRGDQLANELLNKIPQGTQQAGVHPFYQGISSAAGMSDANLKGGAESVAHADPVAQMVRTSSQSRPLYKIDPEKDPLLTGAEKIIRNPLTIIGGEGTHLVQTTQEGIDETLDCEEPGEDVLHTCKSRLQVVIREERGPAQHGSFETRDPGVGFHIYSRGEQNYVSSCTGIHPNRIWNISWRVVSVDWDVPFDAPHRAFDTYLISYSFDSLIKVPDCSWNNQCGALEERADKEHCTYVSKVCTQGPGTRIFEGVPVTKDCWEETYTYSCSYPAKNDCGPLRARGCVQINSACKQQVGNKCVVYTQTYQCKGTKTTRETIVGGSTPFCLDGNCRDQGFEANDEMMASIAQLSILKELQGQLWNGTLFKGADNRCSKCTLSFKDCCGSGKGWGVNLGLAGCSADEKALQLKRQKNLCHFVGTYCSKREPITRICLQKKSTYCCFGSKLFKAFHVQGRSQIGMGWGSAEAPFCRGFTIDEIQRIDFSKLDLREAFEDLMQNFKPGKIDGISQKINERLEIMKQGVRPKMEPQMQQRDGA